MGVSGQRHAPAALYPRGKDPRTHWIGGWVGPRAGLDAGDTRKILCPCRGSNPDRPARSQTLYRLSYRGSLHFVIINTFVSSESTYSSRCKPQRPKLRAEYRHHLWSPKSATIIPGVLRVRTQDDVICCPVVPGGGWEKGDEPTSVTEMKWWGERERSSLAIHHSSRLQIVSVSTMSFAVARD
jgi:hypothetical protein